MLSIKTIQPDTLELLKAISAQPEVQGTRLVGGTALALQYGHRQSIDLDFFGELPEDREVLIDAIRRVGDVMVNNRSKLILQMVVNKVKVDFVDYSSCPWIDAPVVGDGFACTDIQTVTPLIFKSWQNHRPVTMRVSVAKLVVFTTNW